MNEAALLKYFSGDISSKETEAVEEWLESSEENRKIAEEVYHIYYSTETLHKMQTVDVAQAYNRVNKKINTRRRSIFLNRLRHVAALLFLPLFLFTLYLFLKEEPVEFIELRTNPGMVASTTLPDDTKVWINASSYLKYPSTFKGDIRNVHLEGEAYFDVKENKKKKFVVETNKDVKIEVLGTEFNIEAYPQDEDITTTLVSGKVELKYIDNSYKENAIIIKPGDKIAYNIKTKQIESSETPVVVTTAWKDMKVVLRRTSLEETLKILGKRFDTEFIILNEKLKNNSFTGTFDDQQLIKILEHLRVSSGIKYRIIDAKEDETGIKEKTKVELY